MVVEFNNRAPGNKYLHESTKANQDPERVAKTRNDYLRSFDSNHDGQLTREEYVGGSKELFEKRLRQGADPELTAKAEADMLQRAERFIAQHGGVLDLKKEEKIGKVNALAAKLEAATDPDHINAKAAAAAFKDLAKLADKHGNHDGDISKEELKSLIKGASRKAQDVINGFSPTIPQKGEVSIRQATADFKEMLGNFPAPLVDSQEAKKDRFLTRNN